MQEMESLQLTVHGLILLGVTIYAFVTFYSLKKSEKSIQRSNKVMKLMREVSGATLILAAMALASYGAMLFKLAV